MFFAWLQMNLSLDISFLQLSPLWKMKDFIGSNQINNLFSQVNYTTDQYWWELEEETCQKTFINCPSFFFRKKKNWNEEKAVRWPVLSRQFQITMYQNQNIVRYEKPRGKVPTLLRIALYVPIEDDVVGIILIIVFLSCVTV